MGISRIVNTDFWTDEKVIDMYSPEDKYFWLYLLTNPQSKQLGVYKLPKKLIAFQLGYSLDTVKVLLDRFEEKYNAIRYSEETQEIAILNYLKYSIIKGGKPVIDCIIKDISQIKNKSLLSSVYNKTLDFEDERETMKAIQEILSTYNEIDNDNDNDSIVGRYVPRIVPRIGKDDNFKKPSIEEIAEYCRERNNKVNPEQFFDHYESKGWLVGRAKMKDWKASVRTWEKNDFSTQPKGRSQAVITDYGKDSVDDYDWFIKKEESK